MVKLPLEEEFDVLTVVVSPNAKIHGVRVTDETKQDL